MTPVKRTPHAVYDTKYHITPQIECYTQNLIILIKEINSENVSLRAITCNHNPQDFIND